MGWNYLATFSGEWSIPHLPGAALDAAGNLCVMWGDSSTYNLTWFTQQLPPSGQSVTPQTTVVTQQQTEGSPWLALADGQVLALWRGVGDDQSIRICPVSPGSASLTPQTISDANTVDGPTAAYLANPDVLFTVWRGRYRTQDPGNGDTTLYYSNVSQPGNGQFGGATTTSFGDNAFNSFFSPAVVAMPGGGVGVCWKGTGGPGASGGDDQLYFSAATSNDGPQWTPGNAVPITCGTGTVTTRTRPTLALMSSPQAETIVLAYASSPGGTAGLGYLLGTLQNGAVTWAVPQSTNGIVPLSTVLAGAGGGKMTNPVGVWVTTPGSGSPLYLLVGVQAGGSITGPLYLIAYSGE